MKLAIKGIVLGTLMSIVLATTQSAVAAHATDYLDALQQAVFNEVANVDLTAAQEKALAKANKALSKNTKTIAADLTALAAAARALNPHFTGDESFEPLQQSALDAYFAEANSQLEDAEARIGTNQLPKGLSNQLAQAAAMIAAAQANTNGVDTQAQLLAKAFNKLRNPISQIVRLYGNGGGNPRAEAPETADGIQFECTENAPSPSDQSKINFLQTEDGFKYYHIDQPEEEGTWQYEKTGPKTAVLTCNIDYPGTYNDTYPVTLTFKTETTGTFVGRTYLGETLRGTFVMVR